MNMFRSLQQYVLLLACIPWSATAQTDTLQEIISQLTLRLPDFEIAETILFSELKVTASDVQCSDIALGDLQLTSNGKNNELTLQADVPQLDVICTLDYYFRYLFFGGSGSLRMVLNDNTLSTGFNFVTPDKNSFDTHPPSNVTMAECNAVFSIDDMEFSQDEEDSGISADILSSMEGLIRGFVEEDIGTTLCEEFGVELESAFQDMVEEVYTVMEPYLNTPTTAATSGNIVAAPNGVTLIDYTSTKNQNQDDSDILTQLSDNEQPWLTTLLRYQNDNLKLGEVEEEGGDLRINSLIRDNLLEEDASLIVTNELLSSFLPDLDLPILIQDDNNTFAEMTLRLQSLKVYGLDSFESFVLLNPADAHSLNTEIRLRQLRMEANVNLQLSSSTLEDVMLLDPNGALVRDEDLTLTFQLDDLTAQASLLLAIDQGAFGNLKLGSMLYDLDSLLDCFMSSVFQSEITSMLVEVGNLAAPTLEGGFLSSSPMLDGAVKNLVEAGMLMYENAILRALPNVVQIKLQEVINDSSFMVNNNNDGGDSTKATCPQIASTGNQWLDFRDLFLGASASSALGGSGAQPYGSLIPLLYDLGNSLLADPISIASFLLGDVVSEDGNGLYFPGELSGDQLRIWLGSLDATFGYRVSDVRIENMIDSIGESLVILDPVKDEPSLLNNSASAGVSKPLRMSARLMLSVDSDVETIMNDFVIGADIQNLGMALTALLNVMEKRYVNFPIGDLFNFDCWMAMISPSLLDEFGLRDESDEPNAAVHALSMLAQQFNMDLECLECSGPGMLELEELWSTPDIARDFTETGNDLLGKATDVAEKWLQVEIDRRLSEAALRCPHSPEFDDQFNGFSFQNIQLQQTQDESSSVAVALVIVIACGIIIFGAIVCLLRSLVRKRHSKWLRTLPKERLAVLAKRQREEDDKEAELNRASTAMFQSVDEIPSIARYCIPVVILGNIALFLSGHFNVAAEVSIIISFAGQQLEVNDVYAFSMVRSAVEIWSAGGYVLSLGILVFAGIWPYTRQLLFLTLWFLPPTKCSISRRGWILEWLDALAKWSIVDIFTVVVTVAAFRLSIQSPAVGFLPEDMYTVDLLVAPVWGLYANLLAQVISQISSHFIIHYHRNIEHQATMTYRQKYESSSVSGDDEYGDQTDALCKQKFSRPHKAEAEKLVVRRMVNYAIAIGALVICLFIIVGCIIPSVGLEIFGVLGVAVEVGQGGSAAIQELSTFGLLDMMMEQAAFIGGARSYLGLGFLCSVLVVTVLIVPLLQSAVLVYQWFVPMAGKKRKRVSVAIEYLQAWQYAEVYIISVIVASWQLGSISQHLFNEYCESATETLDMLAYFGVIGANDNQCFRTQASIMGGCYVMAAGALLLALLNAYVNSASQQYFRSRDEAIDHETQPQEVSTPATVKMAAFEFEEIGDNGDRTEITKLENSIDGEKGAAEPDDRTEEEPLIRPTRVLFTDKFRWTLCSADAASS